MKKMYRWLLVLQGGYYFLTGIWPILHIGSFMAVTGPKNDLWLVRTVGALVMAMSVAMLVAAWQKKVQPAAAWLCVAGAVAFIAVDVVYVSLGVIGPVYLLDAAAEAVLLLAWLFWFFRYKAGTATAETSRK